MTPHRELPPGSELHFVRLQHPPSPKQLGQLLRTEAAVAEQGDALWLRVRVTHPEQTTVLASLVGEHWLLAATQTGTAIQTDRTQPASLLLRRVGEHVPAARLPAGLDWQPIAEVVRVTLPAPAMGSRTEITERPALRLVSGGKPQAANGLKLPLSRLAAWTENAPAVRMRALRWLVRDDEAFVVGQPLPPIAGQLFVQRETVWIPASQTWQPALPAATILRAFCQAAHRDPEQAGVIWETNACWSIVDDRDWAALSRAAVRAAQTTVGNTSPAAAERSQNNGGGER